MARNPDEVLERLRDGNRRFVADQRVHPRQTPAHRRELALGQRPLAAILGCADSRVSPEIIFDLGLGDLFAVRVAGHVVDDASLGSLEYAVQILDVPLIVVLGHSNCGAVRAAVAGNATQGGIAKLVAAIRPAVEQARAERAEPPDLVLAHAVRIHVARVVSQLCAAGPVLAPLVATGRLKILGAHYDLESGCVEFLQDTYTQPLAQG